MYCCVVLVQNEYPCLIKQDLIHSMQAHYPLYYQGGRWFMVFNVAFNNISVLLVEETGAPRENHRPYYKLNS
jgi:hypothetical protein